MLLAEFKGTRAEDGLDDGLVDRLHLQQLLGEGVDKVFLLVDDDPRSFRAHPHDLQHLRIDAVLHLLRVLLRVFRLGIPHPA